MKENKNNEEATWRNSCYKTKRDQREEKKSV